MRHTVSSFFAYIIVKLYDWDYSERMGSVIFRAFCLLFMIFLGYGLKKIGVLHKDDGAVVARIVLNITLPCALIMGFREFVFDAKLFLIPVVSIVMLLSEMGVGYLLSRRTKSREDSVYYMLSMDGFNIGNFVLPFVSNVLGATGIVAVCLFDIGNAIVCMGIGLLLVSIVVGSDRKVSLGKSILGLFKKPPFFVYTLMLVLAIFNLKLPDFVFEIAGSISPANGPMAMIMIGLMLEFSFKKEHVKKILEVIGIRLGFACLVGYLFYTFAPFDEIIRRAVVVTCFAPVASSAPAFTVDYGGNTELAGFVNSVSIILSMVLIPVLLTVL